MPHGVMLPLTTLNLMVLVPLVTLAAGRTRAWCSRARRPLELARRVREERIGHFTAVPTIYHDLYSRIRMWTLSDLCDACVEPEMGGANIPPAIRELVQTRRLASRTRVLATA